MRFAIAFSDRAWSSRARGVRHVTISVDFPSALAIVFGLCEADGTSPVVQFLIGVGNIFLDLFYLGLLCLCLCLGLGFFRRCSLCRFDGDTEHK